MKALATDAHAHLRREVATSMAINCGLTLAFFLVVFGRSGPVPVWGLGHYVFDFLPQGFMVAFMGTLVPCLLTRKALRAGKVAPLAGPAPLALPHNLPLRAMLLGSVGAALGTGISALTTGMLGLESLAWGVALGAKLAFVASLAFAVTSLALRATLCERGAA